MQKKGRIIYAPGIVIDEIRNIKIEEGIESSAEAFRKMCNYSKIGRKTVIENDIPIGKKIKKWL